MLDEVGCGVCCFLPPCGLVERISEGICRSARRCWKTNTRFLPGTTTSSWFPRWERQKRKLFRVLRSSPRHFFLGPVGAKTLRLVMSQRALIAYFQRSLVAQLLFFFFSFLCKKMQLISDQMGLTADMRANPVSAA